MMLPEAGGEGGFQSGATMDVSVGKAGTPTHCEQRSRILPAYFTVYIKWQCKQGWIGLCGSGLFIKLITMVTGRERSHLPTSIISYNSF